MSISVFWTGTMIELPEVREGGMSGRNEQRKPGTTRGLPRHSRTAKASRISRHAVKSRCAHKWDGWGRLSDDGPGHYNPDLSEGAWGGGVMIHHGGAQSSLRPDTVREDKSEQQASLGRKGAGRRHTPFESGAAHPRRLTKAWISTVSHTPSTRYGSTRQKASTV